jgi:hypothetical protein
MAKNARTTVDFNPKFFDEIMKSAKVEALTTELADEVLAVAKHTAPVDSGDYRAGLHKETRETQYRTVVRVVGDDPKTLLIEAKTGNLARALKAV